MKRRETGTRGSSDPARRRTEVKGQNPKANDAPDQDLYHDENRRNQYDPEVGRALRLPGQRAPGPNAETRPRARSKKRAGKAGRQALQRAMRNVDTEYRQGALGRTRRRAVPTRSKRDTSE